MINKSITELIGNTPLAELCEYEKNHGTSAKILAKLEYFNPAGSIKDRAAFEMIDDAEQRGELKPDSVIIEPTSGNTGIGLAAIAAKKGYKLILTMPESMSIERRKLLSAYGAQLVLTEASLGMAGAVKKAEELLCEHKNAFMPGQFTNKSNARAHYKTTAPELWRDTDGKIDIFVATFGTGGTLTGCARYLKEKKPDIKIVAVEPEGSPLLSKGTAGPHKIQGIGANFIPEILDTSLIDEIITVSDSDAINTKTELALCEGYLVGISSGAACAAARELALRQENSGKSIVAIFPDTGERYLQ